VILINSSLSHERIDLKKYYSQQLPIYLEICSGHGDWIVEKAKNTKGKINWIALEIRYERVFQIWTKSKFNNLDNLLIICGEAGDVLQNYINRNSFKEVFINYPDPPVWEKSTWLLIKTSFLIEVI
jgi:tRNA G46 methylase TrmB